MSDISVIGIQVYLIASTTFPGGIDITQFADDADPLDMASIKIGDVASGANGDLVSWSKAVPLPAVLNVIPGSDDDINLQALAEANRVGRGKLSARDVITMTVIYPDGTTEQRTNGKITDAMFGNSAASAGRFKSKPYAFSFENRTSS